MCGVKLLIYSETSTGAPHKNGGLGNLFVLSNYIQIKRMVCEQTEKLSYIENIFVFTSFNLNIKTIFLYLHVILPLSILLVLSIETGYTFYQAMARFESLGPVSFACNLKSEILI